MLGPNISSEIQHFLKTLIFGYSKNVTKFLTAIIKSNKDKSTMIILLLNTLHLYILFSLENISIYFDTVGQEFDEKIHKFSNFLANFGFVFVSLILVVSSVTTFLPGIMLAKYIMLGKHHSIYVHRCNNLEIINMIVWGFFN